MNWIDSFPTDAQLEAMERVARVVTRWALAGLVAAAIAQRWM